MATNNRYKKFTAAFLMLLYLFIAAPVQYWHQHSAVKPAAGAGSSKQQSLRTCSNQASEANCQVCNHQYSIYQQGATKEFTFYVNAFRNTYTEYVVSIPETPVISFSNKGPPSLG